MGAVLTTGPVVTMGANVEADATAGMVSSVIGVVADFDGAAGAVPHGAMVVVAHDAVSKFLMRPNSLWSIDKFHLALIATHSDRYVHTYDLCGGIQFEGSRSDFDLF